MERDEDLPTVGLQPHGWENIRSSSLCTAPSIAPASWLMFPRTSSGDSNLGRSKPLYLVKNSTPYLLW